MTEEAKARQRAYIIKYQREIYTNISFKLRTKEDSEIIDFLNCVPNKSEYIKNLIKKDMQ